MRAQRTVLLVAARSMLALSHDWKEHILGVRKGASENADVVRVPMQDPGLPRIGSNTPTSVSDGRFQGVEGCDQVFEAQRVQRCRSQKAPLRPGFRLKLTDSQFTGSRGPPMTKAWGQEILREAITQVGRS